MNLEKIINFIDNTPVLSEVKQLTYTGLDKEITKLWLYLFKSKDYENFIFC